MKISHQSPWLWRPTGALVVASLSLPFLMVGCGSRSAPTPPPSAPAASNQGMSGRQKLTLLAGAAAMYYLYRKYQRDNAAALQKAEAAAPGGKIQYYRSKKGGYIYFRDPRNPKVAIKVTPPQSEVGTRQVNPDELRDYDYQKFEGYNNAPSGETLDKYFPVQ
ncbi:hypothetical protein EON80_06470 [bacterium]|nr:MAG: hypothetical protein EON80_06470 [bacterium]